MHGPGLSNVQYAVQCVASGVQCAVFDDIFCEQFVECGVQYVVCNAESYD